MGLFEEAIGYLARSGISLDNENKLSLYGLFKQAKYGNCKGLIIIRKQAICI